MKSPTSYYLVLFCIFLLAIIVRLQGINLPLLNAHYFRQTQTATVAKNFYATGIDIFHPKIDIAGIGKEQNLILEFPFYQAVVAFISYIFGYSDRIGRVVAIFFGIIGAFLLAQLVYSITQNKLLSIISIIFFLFVPLTIFYQQAYMIESTVGTLHIASIYFCFKYLKKRNNILILLFEIITIIAVIQKTVYAPFLLLTLIGLIFLQNLNIKQKLWTSFILLSIPLISFFSWQRYVDISNTFHGQGYFTSSNPGQQLWNFGTISERFIWKNWEIKMNALSNNLTKLFFLPFLLGILYLIFHDFNKNKFWLIWLGSMILYYVLFFRIQSHEYYFMIIIPVLSVIASYGFLWFLTGKYKITYLFVGVYVILFMFKSIHNSRPYFYIDESMAQELQLLNHTMSKPGPMIILLEQYDWNSVYTYYTGRKGIALGFTDTNKERIDLFRKQNYRYVIVENYELLFNINPNLYSYLSTLSQVIKDNNIAIYEI